nr:MAG TPA: hypothetical protein [Caudoviricetes sp.]
MARSLARLSARSIGSLVSSAIDTFVLYQL